MQIKYIIEMLEYYEISYDISFIENKADELIIFNKDEFYDITEFLSENYISHEILFESYDSIILKLTNLKSMKSEITSYYDLILNYKEILIYYDMLKNSSDYYNCFNRLDEYENESGTNKLNDIINKFHMDHKNYYTFNLDESYSDLYDLISGLISDSDLYKNFKFLIYENLNEFYENHYNYNISKFKDYIIKISDESNILIDMNSYQIRNINESDYKKIIEYIIKSNFFYENEINYKYIPEFIELINAFQDYNSYEILENTEYNINYLNNKYHVNFTSFKKYYNTDEYILLRYDESNNNISLTENDIIKMSAELLDSIISASEYYEYDSYEFKKFIRILKILI